jgi:hypothetical protein
LLAANLLALNLLALNLLAVKWAGSQMAWQGPLGSGKP